MGTVTYPGTELKECTNVYTKKHLISILPVFSINLFLPILTFEKDKPITSTRYRPIQVHQNLKNSACKSRNASAFLDALV